MGDIVFLRPPRGSQAGKGPSEADILIWRERVSQYINGFETVSDFTESGTIGPNTDSVYLDGTSASVTATLPTAVGIKGRHIEFVVINDDNDVFVATQTGETLSLDADPFQMCLVETIDVQSDGANWWVIS